MPLPSRCILILCALVLSGCGRRQGIERIEWTVMGTVAAVQWRSSDMTAAEGRRAAGRVRKVFMEVDALLSRHNPQSELCRLQALPDGEIINRCEPSVRKCYEAAFRLRDETGGAFDPRWRGEGTLDLGAIAKGFAVDIAAEAADAPCLIDLGGNLKAVGGAWKTAIAFSGERLDLGAGMAVATSAEYFRGSHIHDARTGKAVESGASVSVVHPSSAMLADALSTVLFILGREKGAEFISSRYPGAEAVWVERPAAGDINGRGLR
jgi:thiamine biosynthesis lipoprotein